MENWKPINGYEERYLISDKGRIKSYHSFNSTQKKLKDPILAKIQEKPNGYKFKMLYKNGTYKSVYVHRLVAEHFIPNPNDLPLVLHKDDDRSNNGKDNLYWGTHSDNERDKGKNGIRQNKGQEHGMAKLSRDQVVEIKERIKDGKELYKDIAKDFPVSKATISDIGTGKSWSHV